MNKSKYITYTTMALVAFIIIEMNLFTFMFVKGQDEKEYKFEYGTVMDVRGALGIKFLIEIAMGIYEIIDGIKNKNQVYLGVRMNGWIILCGAMLIISAFIFAAYFVW